jgi:hypothetical protein
MNERSQQVRIMQSIYQEAFLVISWLGPEEEELGLGLSSIELIGREMDSQNEREDDMNLDWINLYPILWEENVEEGVGNKAWNAIRKLLRLKYWFRVWVVQEMVLAKLLFMMLGKRSISFRSFEWIAVLLNGTQSGRFQKLEFVPQNLWRYLSIAGWFRHFLSVGTVCLFRQIHRLQFTGGSPYWPICYSRTPSYRS